MELQKATEKSQNKEKLKRLLFGLSWRCVTRSLQRRQQNGTDAIHFSLEVFRQ